MLILEKVQSGTITKTAIDQLFTQYRVPAKERPLATEIVYGTMRNRSLLDRTISRYLKAGISHLADYHRNVLRISLYQHLFLSSIPDYAIVDEAVKLVFNKKDKSFINAVLRRVIAAEKTPTQEPMTRRWLQTMLANEYGATVAAEIVRSFSSRPRYSIRLDQPKHESRIRRALARAGIKCSPGRWHQEYLTVDRLGPLLRHTLFEDGLVSVQDQAEGLVAHLLDPQAGETIVDLCAGPGGKTSHIAELMADQGSVLAVDVDPAQLAHIIENRHRLRLNCIRPVLADACRLTGLDADRVLVDAPCSNLGTIRKKPELLDRLKPADVKRLGSLQLALLKAAASNLRPGGILVYSTCTILGRENEEVIERFLGEYDFEIEPAEKFLPAETSSRFLKIGPQQFDTDGVFAARLKKGPTRRPAGRRGQAPTSLLP